MLEKDATQNSFLKRQLISLHNSLDKNKIKQEISYLYNEVLKRYFHRGEKMWTMLKDEIEIILSKEINKEKKIDFTNRE